MEIYNLLKYLERLSSLSDNCILDVRHIEAMLSCC